jgi:hypothetical protein
VQQGHVQWYTVAKTDEEYVVIEKDDPEDLDDKKRLRTAREDAKRKLKAKLKNKKIAEAAAQARRDKMRSVSKGDVEMQEDPIVAIAKAWSAGSNAPRVTKK